MSNIYTFVSNDKSIIKEKILDKCNELKLDNIVKYDEVLSDTDLNKIIEDLRTLSLFETDKAVIVSNSAFLNEKNNKSDKEQVNKEYIDKVFLPYLNDPNPNSYLFLGVESFEKVYKEYQNILKKCSEVIEIKDIDLDYLIAYGKKELKENSLSAKDNVLKEIALRSNLDYTAFKNNLNLLITYKFGSDSINMEDVDKMIFKEEDAKIYELADSIIKKDKRKIYDTYYSLKHQNIENDKILNSIISKFITLLNVKRLSGTEADDKKIGEILNLKDKQVYAVKRQAANFSLNELKEKLNFFLEMDAKVKTGYLNLEKDLLTSLLK